MTDEILVFDRAAVRRHRERSAATLPGCDVLFREVAERLTERLEEVTRAFPLALDLGCRNGLLGQGLGRRGAVETLVQCDLSQALVRTAAAPGRLSLVADEEALPFAAGSFDLVMSALALHWVNDLPGALLQVRQALKPDGLFLAALFGGETLRELRAALLEAESEIESGASPRVSPFAELRDAGGLLQRAGFALPVADQDTITVRYPSALALMRDLRAMGETNAVLGRRKGLSRRTTLARAAALYEERHRQADGKVPATFQVLYLTGWTPHESQQKPLAPGSAFARLADALDSAERSAGEAAPETKTR